MIIAKLTNTRVEAPEGRSLPAILAPQLRQALLRLSRNDQAKDLAQRALRALARFAKGLKVKYDDIEVGFDFDPEPGLADNGDTAFTVPLFDEFMRRIMPGDDWAT